jgi:glycosyltransferase involved in cell wall biosynthesis
MKLSYFSPLPPERSGIADYSVLLLPALEQVLDVEVARRGRRPPRSDVALYQIGNDPNAHGWIVEELRRRPGVVVLHELVLHHLVAGMTLGRSDAAGYLEAMEREGGLPGRLLAHGVVEGTVPAPWEVRPEAFPLAGEVLRHATAVIVHSRFVEQGVRELGFAGRIFRVAHPAWPVPSVEAADLAGSPVIGCFGHLNPSKRIPELLVAFARLLETHPEARLLLVGPVAPRVDLAGQLARLGLERSDAILREDYVDEARLWALMRAADVCVSLRWPTMGETSGAVIRALVLGKPLVVSDVGWFTELPADAALRIPVDGHETELLAATLDLLARDEQSRAAMSAAARRYATSELDLGRVAEGYATAVEAAAGGDLVSDAVLRDVAQAAAEVGISVDDPELSTLAGALRELRIAS